MMYISIIVQLGDYTGTLEPHISFIIENDESISFMSFMALFKNSCLIFLLHNVMPDTKIKSDTSSSQVFYGIYQLIMPSVIALSIAIPITLAMKQQEKYQQLTEQFSQHSDISIFIMTPIFTFLVAEMLGCSGLNTLIACGIFQSVYAKHNLNDQKNSSIDSTVNYLAYLMRQVGSILIGIFFPCYM